MRTLLTLFLACTLNQHGANAQPARTTFSSHPPMRTLPQPSARPIVDGPAYFVDPVKGDDENDGSKANPWKSIQHGTNQLKPGDTLYLRGGTYYENVRIKLAGTKKQPIKIRSFPGELAIVDGGLREFYEASAKAWEPAPGGAKGEFRSTKTYKNIGPIVMGNFGDSMVPLHGYKYPVDLRTDNEFWNLPNNAVTDQGIYCGPGLWYDGKSGRIHIRLAHTHQAFLPEEDQYRGETDPRKLKLVISTSASVLHMEGCQFVRIQDIVFRGSSRRTIDLSHCEEIELDGITAYGGSPALMINQCKRLKITNCAFRSIAAPWSWRSSHKYRGVAAYCLTIRGSTPPSEDFEFAHSEFTDGHDGPFIGTVKGMKFHHNLVDNFNDDGVYLMAMNVGGNLQIYQNRLSRCLHIFSFAGNYPVGAGVYIYRNIIDMRPPVHYFPPKSKDDERFVSGAPDGKPGRPSRGRLCGDHGGPIWEPIYFYHNTVLADEPGFRSYYGLGWGGHTRGTTRRVFNNMFLQVHKKPGLNFASTRDDLHVDYNLHWNVKADANLKGNPLEQFQKSAKFAESKKLYGAGWTVNDIYADPKFLKWAADYRTTSDLRLQKSSPAIDAGMKLPKNWPDAIRHLDVNRPDIGALPFGSKKTNIGPNGQ